MPSIDIAAAEHAGRHAKGGPDEVTPAAIGAATTGHTHAPADIGAVPATRFLTGAGSPNGAVSAPVGTEYTDTAGTNGAHQWYKASGTGNTGWVVLVGDTGPRDISSYLTNGWELGSHGFVSVRRIDTIVELTVERINSASAATNFLFGGTYPTGFRPPRNVRLLFHTHASVPEVRRGVVNTDVEVVNGMNSGQFYSVQLYTTDEPWPSTLPGTPL